jgi:3-oxoacyl-[acyl-carrier-protein] synthase-3
MAIDHIGNISSASVPTALDESRRKGRLAEDDLVVMVALGGGMAWASTLYRWAGPEVIQKARQLTSNGKTPPSAGP